MSGRQEIRISIDNEQFMDSLEMDGKREMTGSEDAWTACIELLIFDKYLLNLRILILILYSPLKAMRLGRKEQLVIFQGWRGGGGYHYGMAFEKVETHSMRVREQSAVE